MADVHDKKTRSYNMSRIRSKDTTPELLVRKFLHANGFRYRLHVKDLPGKPDIVLPRYQTIIDVRGCFWHGHRNCKWGDEVKSESGIMQRVKSAIERDKANEEKWQKLGWKIIIVWDRCQLNVRKKTSERREEVLNAIVKQLRKASTSKIKSTPSKKTLSI